MRYKNSIILILYLCVFLFVFVLCHDRIGEARKDLSLHYRLHASPLPPELFTIFAGEFRGLLADYLVLEVGSVLGVGQKIPKQEYEKSALVLAQALALDPYFQQTYLYVQALVAWEGELPEKAIPLLDIARSHRPWDWRPGYYMGFDYYYFLGDFSRASEAFLDAAKISDSPVLLASLGSRLALRGKRTAAAIHLLESMLDDPFLDQRKVEEISDRITALRGVLLLEKALIIYRSRYGAYPPSMDVLIKEGILGQMPLNPYSDRFYYDQEEGRVFFDELR